MSKKKKLLRLHSGCLYREAFSVSHYWQFKKLFFTFGDDRIDFPSVKGCQWIYAKSSTFHGWTHVNSGSQKHCIVVL